jgi:hypothetical protein
MISHAKSGLVLRSDKLMHSTESPAMLVDENHPKMKKADITVSPPFFLL